MSEKRFEKPPSGKNRARAERQAKALRENLKRRKARSRNSGDDARGDAEPPVPAGGSSKQP